MPAAGYWPTSRCCRIYGRQRQTCHWQCALAVVQLTLSSAAPAPLTAPGATMRRTARPRPQRQRSWHGSRQSSKAEWGPGHDCLHSQMWWSAEMHRLAYSEWQSSALPRMVRRWPGNKNHRQQCDDDAASTAWHGTGTRNWDLAGPKPESDSWFLIPAGIPEFGYSGY